MIKTLAAAAVLSLGLAGYAVAQEARCCAAPMRGPITITTIIITASPSSHECIMWLKAAPAPGSHAISRMRRDLRFGSRETSSSPDKISVRRAFVSQVNRKLSAAWSEDHPSAFFRRSRLRVLTSTRGPSARRTTAPHNRRFVNCVCPASSPIVPPQHPKVPKFSLWRATVPVAPPNRRGIDEPRPCCRSGARF